MQRPVGDLRMRFVLQSKNRKTGPIPVSMSSAFTCPTSCAWLNNGCYAENHLVGLQWRRLDERKEGMSYEAFLQCIRALPANRVWRHNVAGDLAGEGDRIDPQLLWQLCVDSNHTKGFTYTHKPVLGNSAVAKANRAILRRMREYLFTINLSADTPAQADEMMALQIAPVTLMLPRALHGTPRTPGGHRVVTCPAVQNENVTCLTCQLCTRAHRSTIVGFPAHGCKARAVAQSLVQLKLFKEGR